MIIRKGETKKEGISNGIVWDYPMPSKETGLAVQELNGRVPEKGRFLNKICNEICFVIKGSCTLFLDEKKFDIYEGDVFIIKHGQKSHLIANKLKMLTITSPDWHPEQCEIVDS